MKRVAVLLSTYNGERFIAEQIESVLGQQGVDLTLLVRDDGSTDRTRDLLGQWASDRRVKIYREGNVGFIASFFRLLELATDEPDYFAFCDQDDVWQSDKLRHAVDALARLDDASPLLYCGRVTITRRDLSPIGFTRPPARPLSFNNAVVESMVTGCTAVLNRALRSFVLRHSHAGARSHDWWLYLVATAFGKVHYDPDPRILYRQHEANAVGAGSGRFAHWRRRLMRAVSGKHRRFMPQIEAFRASFGAALAPDQRRILDELIASDRSSLAVRLRVGFSTAVYRQTIVDDLMMRALLILGRL